MNLIENKYTCPLTDKQRHEYNKRISHFTQTSLVGITIPVPSQLTDDEILMFIDFIDYYYLKTYNDEIYKQKRNALIDKMTEHFNRENELKLD